MEEIFKNTNILVILKREIWCLLVEESYKHQTCFFLGIMWQIFPINYVADFPNTKLENCEKLI